MGLSRNYEGNTQLARKLEPAIRELEERGFLEPLPHRRAVPQDGRKWRVKFVRKERAGVDAVDLPDGPSPELVAELANRGVTVQTARALVASFPPDRIRAKIEIYDFELVRGTLTSPAGFLVRAIERDYARPGEDEGCDREGASAQVAGRVRPPARGGPRTRGGRGARS